ncbi:MAG: protein TolR [Gammaproteobacteria bacterium]
MNPMRRRGRGRQMSEINVVPYIDVMLVLLVIFMVTAPMFNQGVEVDLPQASAQPIPSKESEPLVLSVNVNGDLFLSVGDEPDKPLTEREVVNKTAAVLKLRPDTAVLVRGDEDVDYGKVVRGMVLLQGAGAPKVGLMTQSPAEGGN